ncbi:MAG: type IV pilus twitching motility protein PilT [Planctomycetota bacterium]|jgi:twitching motility protein PilT
MATMPEILELAKSRGASDVHVVAGSPVLLRVEGKLIPATRKAVNSAGARELSYHLMTREQILEFERTRDLDFMTSDESKHRFRVNVSYNDGDVGTVIRLLPGEPLSLEQLHLPEVIGRLVAARKGLILITGSTSQGKTTTMAAMIDAINRTDRKHVVTIEDPIEYVHENRESIVRQRQVGQDTKSFDQGLRAALRQDPDVIGIGEMRDYETIKPALTAAETGVLVMTRSSNGCSPTRPTAATPTCGRCSRSRCSR